MDSFLNIPWSIWGVLCLIVAGAYAIYSPKVLHEDDAYPAWRKLAIRWGQSVVWVVLALSCFARPQDGLAVPLVIAAAALYIGYVVILFQDRRAAMRAASR
jgi:hypothetical protein